MWASASSGLGNLVNSGTITNGPNGVIKSVSLNNTGTIKGAGYMYFTGFTTTTNVGTTGVAGITTDTIKFYDVSRTSPLTIYDDQRGIVYPNVVYRVFPAPDTTGSSPYSCAVEYVDAIPLPVKWNYFFASLTNDIPTLFWSCQYDAGTTLNIERSTDGSNFNIIKTIAAEKDQSEYQFEDALLPGKANFIYYRIKAIEPTGMQRYSEIRTVKFINQPANTIQLAPNPFTNGFNIYYQSAKRGSVDLKIFDVTGQEKMRMSSRVGVGLNSISVNKISYLAAGIYLVQVSLDNKVVATEKMVKQ
jgi:hypothetical protein